MRIVTVFILTFCFGLIHSQGLAQEKQAYDFEFKPTAADSAALVKVTEVAYGGASSIRLYLDGTHLSDGSYLLIKGEDGAKQKLGASELANWKHSSAIFNGGKVSVHLYSHGEGADIVKIEQVSLSYPDTNDKGETTNTRDGKPPVGKPVEFLYHTKAVGRITNGTLAYGTGWIAPNGAIVTSNQIRRRLDDGFNIIEFNVPPSNPDGSLNHPGPEDQYIIQEAPNVPHGYQALFRFKNRTDWEATEEPDLGISAYRTDWAVLEALPNHTGFRPGERQQAYFRVVNNPTSSILDAIDVDVDILHYGEKDSMAPGEDFRVLQLTRTRLMVQNDYIRSVNYLSAPVSLDDDDLLVYHMPDESPFSGSMGAPIAYKGENIALGVHHTSYVHAPAGALGFRDELLRNALGSAFGNQVSYVDIASLYDKDATGEVHKPFASTWSGVQHVPEGGTIFIAKGHYPLPLTIDKAMTLKAPVGKVVMGSSSSKASSRIQNDTILQELIKENLTTELGEAAENELTQTSKQAYPNPFTDMTRINYYLEKESSVDIRVYDLIGAAVATLVSEIQPAGMHQVNWQGNDHQGAPLTPGMYFIRIQAGDEVSNLKVLKN